MKKNRLHNLIVIVPALFALSGCFFNFREVEEEITVTPPKIENASCFFKEIREDYGMDLNNEIWICPRCGGRLKRQNGPFIGCVKCEFKRNVD